ncbi:MAG: DUF503 family protein [Proteobacteria bacterium]|jgi:uncharacterized protein YlxP (DUF503 family)|nr:DUF503 family protein [Pseudomonadota bacterium]MDA1301876.1 DUF503 family protein [Pseudomonadota bacterium]
MQLQLLTVQFRFAGCGSLKEKRGRQAGLRERLGRMATVAIAETGDQDRLDSAQWTLVLMADSSRRLDQLRSTIDEVLLRVDGELISQRSETIPFE